MTRVPCVARGAASAAAARPPGPMRLPCPLAGRGAGADAAAARPLPATSCSAIRSARMTSSARRARFCAAAVGIATIALWLAAAALGLPPFTTAPKAAPAVGTAQAEVFGLAAGCHATYDRLVLRTRFGTPGYSVRYVARIVRDPSGLPLALAGTKRLLVVLRPARGHTAGGASLLPAVASPSCANLRQVKVAGDFEGVVSLGLGLQRTAGFRVFRLSAPARIVVDIAH